MKKIFIVVLSAIVLISCSNKAGHETESGDWKELNDFHKIMAKAYHPLRDSGNVGRTKKLIKELADLADTWANSTLPERVNTPDVKEKLQKLKSGSRSLADEVSGGASDEVIKDHMNKLHDQFHSIMESWNHHDDKEESEEKEH